MWKKLFVIFLMEGICRVIARNIPNGDLLSKEELQKYSRDGSAISEFEIISPQLLHNGVFKRSIHSSHHPPTQDLHFTAFSEDYKVRLTKNDWLLRQGLNIEVIDEDGSLQRRPVKHHDCHYYGTLLGHEKSAAALSLCNGVRGIVSHNTSDYIIQPLHQDHVHQVRQRSKRDVDNPHIIFKREAPIPQPLEQTSEHPVHEEQEEHIPVERHGDERHQPFCSYESSYGSPPSSLGLRRTDNAIAQPLQFVGQKHLELFVLADKDMYDFHGEDTEEYVFSLMNIVSRRFADPSLDISLRIHIVKFIILKTDTANINGESFEVSGNAETLDAFCTWQSRINPPDDSHREHWDNAILLSRKNLFTINGDRVDRSLLGKAFLSSTCRTGLECSFNQDDGLGSSLIIAHEMGHTLGLNHDNDYGCPSGMHIMSSWRPVGPDSFTWSSCSRRNIRDFLRGPVATCLDDEPSADPLPVNEPAGLTYDREKQCELAIGSGATPCRSIPNDCGYLRCRNATGCYNLGVAVMDGTTCNTGKWCMKSLCVPKGALPGPINGDWSEWDENFGSCSRTCGGGVQLKRRYCNNPTPLYGGISCTGPAEEYEACNLEPCDNTDDEFRDQQCMETNRIPFNGFNYTWNAFLSGQTGDDLCDKKCLSNSRFWASRPPYKFTDGTNCWHDEDLDVNKVKMCVSGKCKEFGCDGVVGSGKVYDVCRRCNGNGATCESVTGTFNDGEYRSHTEFLEIPRGATSVEITNNNLAYTHLAVAVGGEYLFKGHLFTPAHADRYAAGNSIVKYSTDYRNFREKISITGPLSVPVTIHVYLLYDPAAKYGVDVRPTISYQYYNPRTGPVYTWKKDKFGECSATCGGGHRFRTVRCVQINNGIQRRVNPRHCRSSSRPSSVGTCGKDQCPSLSIWIKGSWTECSVTCGEGFRTRYVTCRRDGHSVSDEQCDADSQPHGTKSCNLDACPLWTSGPWSECNVSCGPGTQSRSVVCQNSGNEVTLTSCSMATRPSDHQSCDAGTCAPPAEWATERWSECSVSCGDGRQSREVVCKRGEEDAVGDCVDDDKPRESRDCEMDACPPAPQWVIGQWRECSASCGTGEQTRTVRCRQNNAFIPPSNCPQDAKPSKERTCEVEPCPTSPPATWIVRPWSECSVTCGAGDQTRLVQCVQGGVLIAPRYCPQDIKPPIQRICEMDPCPTAVWTVGSWSMCNVECGEGEVFRSVECRRGSNAAHGECDHEVKPRKRMSCQAEPCVIAQWTIGEWSDCNVECGTGNAFREVECVKGDQLADGECNLDDKPNYRKSCEKDPCIPVKWYTGQWSECNVQCGTGEAEREVKCRRGSELATGLCNLDSKPVSQRRCYVGPCIPAKWKAGEWSACDAECGDGMQTRTVECWRGDAQATDECLQISRPVAQQVCQSLPCDLISTEDIVENEVCNVVVPAHTDTLRRSTPTGETPCTTVLTTPFGKSVSIHIHSLNVDCDAGESFRIREGTRWESFCGEVSDTIRTFRDNVIAIEIKTLIAGHGYRLSYERINGKRRHDCDQLYTQANGILKSPRYPRSYPANANCKQRIITEPGRTIRLVFSRLHLQGTYPTCQNDKIEITDMVTGFKRTYCDSRRQLSLVSTGYDYLVQFKSDSRTSYTGYRATFTTPPKT